MRSRCSDGLTAGTGLDEGCLYYKINSKDWLIVFHLLECLTTKSLYYFLYNIPQPLSRGKTRFYRNYELAVYLFGGHSNHKNIFYLLHQHDDKEDIALIQYNQHLVW